MSPELGVTMCPACGGDRTSVASNEELYCVDCNRIYLAFESHGSKELALAPTGWPSQRATHQAAA